MTDWWTSEAGLITTSNILTSLAYISMGAFLSDCISTASFDWSLLSGRKEHRWMHIFYFGAKISLFIFLVLNIAVYWFTYEVDCHTYMYGLEFMMGMAVITSSAILAFRTIVVNSCNGTRVPVKAILGVAGLGLIAAWAHGITDVSAVWYVTDRNPWTTGACVPAAIKDTYFVKYVVTIVFDFLVLALAVRGILLMNSGSRFGDILIRQGVIYFVLAFLANLAITVLTLLRLSPMMSLVLAVPQSTICIIASTRLYSQLVVEGSNNTHVPSTRRTSFQDSDLAKRSGISDTMTLEEGLQIEVHTLTQVYKN